MSLANALRRVVDDARAFGPSAALHGVRQRAINRVLPFYILECASLRPSDVNPRFLDAGPFRAGFARRDEILRAAGPEHDMTPEFVAEAFDRGDECFALYDGDRLASSIWFATRPTPVADDFLVHFDAGWVYNYKGFTHPDYRGKRLYSIGLTQALRSYAARGSRGVLSYVRSTNFPSRRARAHTGQRVFGKIYVVRVRGRALAWSSPGCRAYGFRLESVAARSTLAERS
jgi:hypothetical protein